MVLHNRGRRGRATLSRAASRHSWLAAWSPAEYSTRREVRTALIAHSRGRMLDAGCGTLPFRSTVEPKVEQYIALDIEQRTHGLDVLGDVHHLPIANGTIDTVLVSEVLEHLHDPLAALTEVRRVLRPGGKAIVSTPFLARIHEAPHDFNRLTEFGLASLAAQAGLEVESLTVTGSIASFLGHQLASALVPPAFSFPLCGYAAALFSSITITPLAVLGDLLARAFWRELPLGYVMVLSFPRG